MHLLVIAANGRTGRLVVEQALARGHTVTALARQAEPAFASDTELRYVVGDATQPADLARVVPGHDAVVMAVATSPIVRALVPAMHAAGVRRLIMPSSRSITATRPRLAVTLAWLIFRGPYADLARAEGMLELSGLDWSIVRATMLADGPWTGRVHTDFEANATGGDWRLNRADYAATLLDAVNDPTLIERAIGVCGAKPSRRRAPRPA